MARNCKHAVRNPSPACAHASTHTSTLHTLSLSHTSVRSHVLGGGRAGGGGGGRRQLQTALAAQAAAEAVEAVHVGAGGVVHRNAPGLRVKRVLLVDVVIVPVPERSESHRGRGAAGYYAAA